MGLLVSKIRHKRISNGLLLSIGAPEKDGRAEDRL